jgi:Cof subfamily protein (haloacid dehalogenase superfamily)
MDFAAHLRGLFPQSSIAPDVALDESLVRQLLAAEPRRLAHVLGVVQTARELGPQFRREPEFASDLVRAALFHDIAYASELRVTGFHPLDAAIFLAHHRAASDVVSAVLFHTGAEGEAVAHPHAAPVYASLKAPESVLMDALTFCDLRTSPIGERITVPERIHEIAERYGPDHSVTKNILSQAPGFRRTCDRVLRGIAKAAPQPLPWLFIDIDSTLVVPGQALSRRNRQAVRTYVDAGGRICLATGKHPQAILSLLEELDIEGPHIAGNGTVALVNGVPQLLHKLGPLAGGISELLATVRVPYVSYSLQGVHLESADVTDNHIDALTSIDEPMPARNLPSSRESVFKVLAFVGAEAVETENYLRSKASALGVQAIRTSSKFLEFVPLASSKGAAMRIVLQQLDWPSFHTIAVGDSENDLPLLRFAGRSVAVANAPERVRAAAEIIVPACEDDGAAHAIESLLATAGSPCHEG